MTLSAGTRLGPYEILSPLGAGGMGEVYRAKDSKLGRDLAIKVLPEAVAQDAERLARFEREARTLATLNHPNIVTIFAVEDSGGTRFLAMELVEGETLDTLIASGGLPLSRFLEITVPLAEALSAAHERGIVHRDSKPGNVMVTREGRVKVLDFGLAKLGAPDSDPNLTDTPTESRANLTGEGQVFGTVAYMSPEQARGGKVDARSDVFSLGVVFYQMLTGERPFQGASAVDMISSILRDKPPSVTDLRADLPPHLARILRRCLEKDPRDRYQTSRDVYNELKEMRAEIPSTATSGARRGFDGARDSAADSRPSPAVGASGIDRRSIVVLPFANLSPDADNEYFSDGLTEEIIADLSKVRALRVISRTSAMQLKGAKKDVQTIGRELNVRYVLEGGVRKAGNGLRITAQSIDALTDAHLWSDKYSGTIDDVFEVQERVSREIVRALDVTLTSDEHRRLGERPIVNARAFELYLQARQEVRRMRGDSFERASRLLSQAVAIEGETTPLLALMARAKVMQVRAGIHRDLRPLDEAEAQARVLLERESSAADGHALLGYIAYERGQLLEAVGHFQRFLEREPNDADALFYVGVSYIGAGQNDRARETAQRSVACDPLSAQSWTLKGVAPWFIGRFDEGIPDLQHALELDPQDFLLQWSIGYTYAGLGRLSEAARHAAFLHEVGPDVPYTRQLLALLDGLEGRKETASERLAPIDVTPLDAHNKFHLAESFGLAGETDRALDLLELAVNQGFYPFPFIAEHCPFLAPLRPLPRFAGILAKAKERSDSFRKSENTR